MKIVRALPFSVLIILCLTLGLAPFSPEPDVWVKIKLLAAGELTVPIDIFDLCMHGLPFVLLFIKMMTKVTRKEN
ncbi:MAG: RND transporter [Desulfofustis sp.]|nr:RND transporter [Desulfofustis sp.]